MNDLREITRTDQFADLTAIMQEFAGTPEDTECAVRVEKRDGEPYLSVTIDAPGALARFTLQFKPEIAPAKGAEQTTEAAMTREQVLEEAWRKRCNDPTVRNDRASFLIFQAGFDAALAERRAEPAPAADAEKVGNDLMRELAEWGFIAKPAITSHKLHTLILAALCRYAGDGVTDEMVEAASRVLTNGWPGLISSANMRAALEAAARAASKITSRR